MKKLILIVPFIFLFFQKINGQVEPRLVEKLTEEYSESLGKWVEKTKETFKYDYRGNEIEYAIITYSILGEIESWEGVKHEYDVNNLLQKKTVRRYNWEIGIWINEYWVDHFYDEDNCLIERHRTSNSIIEYPRVEILDMDMNCREMGYTQYYITDDFSNYESAMIFKYDDRGNLIYSQNALNFSNLNIVYEGLISYTIKQTFNEQDDRTYYSECWTDSLGVPVFDCAFFLFEYDYQFDDNNRIERKFITNYQVGPSTPDAVTIGTTEVLYEYTCDGRIIKEEITNGRYILNINDDTTVTFYDSQRYFYTYEGHDPCFSFENKLNANIYPNPTSGNIQIESPFLASGNTQIRIIDVTGKVMLEQLIWTREGKSILDVEHLANGTYFLQLWSGEHFVSEKIVIVK